MPARERNRSARSRGEDTRRAIKVVAARRFRANGYLATGLEDIGGELGITRSAVLFHYRSKDALLREIVEPFVAGIDGLLQTEADELPLGEPGRRRFLEALFDWHVSHADVSVLVSRDLSSRMSLDIEDRSPARMQRLAELLVGPDPTPSDRAILRAVIGLLLFPLADPDFDPTDRALRTALIDGAVQMTKRAGVKAGGDRCSRLASRA